MKNTIILIVMMVCCVSFCNEVAVQFIKQNEGFKPNVHYVFGKAHIGYGFTSKKYVERKYMTEKEATIILKEYVTACQTVVKKNVKVKLTQNQEAVLIDFIYHFGGNAFIKSTLLKQLTAGKFDQVPVELAKWVKQKKVVDGETTYVVEKGLKNRADRRIALWNKK